MAEPKNNRSYQIRLEHFHLSYWQWLHTWLIKVVKEHLLFIPGGNIPLVRRVAAAGAMTLQWMLNFLPSLANVLLNPTRANLAALPILTNHWKSVNSSDRVLPIISLTKISINSGSWWRQDDLAVILFAEVRPCCSNCGKRTAEVNPLNQVPVIITDVAKGLVS